MNKVKFTDLAYLYLYEEISDPEKVELENYILENDEAKREFESMKQLHSALVSNSPAKIGEKALQESRQTLLRNIRNLEYKESWFTKFTKALKESFLFEYKFALSGVATLAIGMFLGYLFFTPSSQDGFIDTGKQINIDELEKSGIDISNIRFKNPFNQDGSIEVTFNAVKPVTYKGKASDEVMQRLLAAALVNSENPGTRLKSLNQIKQQSKKNFNPDPKIKSALITALKVDENPGVRREALNVLMNFPFDLEIRDAFLFVLESDPNSGMRVSAINALTDLKQQGTSIDDEIKSVLNKQIQTDESDFIKIRAASLLQEVSENE
ncbi:MAG: HEAT repeat domain-containing protein [Ignavibacteria bacterium]|jgi:hypothetical protein